MVHRDGSAVYGEVDALVTLLGYKTANAGCCKARQRGHSNAAGGHSAVGVIALNARPPAAAGGAAPAVGQRYLPIVSVHDGTKGENDGGVALTSVGAHCRSESGMSDILAATLRRRRP